MGCIDLTWIPIKKTNYKKTLKKKNKLRQLKKIEYVLGIRWHNLLLSLLGMIMVLQLYIFKVSNF